MFNFFRMMIASCGTGGRSYYPVSGPTIAGSLGWNPTNPQRVGCQQQRWDGGEATQSLSVAGFGWTERWRHTFPLFLSVLCRTTNHLQAKKVVFQLKNTSMSFHEFPRLRLVGFKSQLSKAWQFDATSSSWASMDGKVRYCCGRL